jgi:hypothetical protein
MTGQIFMQFDIGGDRFKKFISTPQFGQNWTTVIATLRENPLVFLHPEMTG